jgi:hypothetical protein
MQLIDDALLKASYLKGQRYAYMKMERQLKQAMKKTSLDHSYGFASALKIIEALREEMNK